MLTSAANTTTLAHTTANTDNRILLVSVGMNIRNATATAVASVTYGGSPLTKLNAVTDSQPDTRTEVWYLLAPPTGANNVVMTAGTSRRVKTWRRSSARRRSATSTRLLPPRR